MPQTLQRLLVNSILSLPGFFFQYIPFEFYANSTQRVGLFHFKFFSSIPRCLRYMCGVCKHTSYSISESDRSTEERLLRKMAARAYTKTNGNKKHSPIAKKKQFYVHLGWPVRVANKRRVLWFGTRSTDIQRLFDHIRIGALISYGYSFRVETCETRVSADRAERAGRKTTLSLASVT